MSIDTDTNETKTNQSLSHFIPAGYVGLYFKPERSTFKRTVDFAKELGIKSTIDKKVVSRGSKLLIRDEIPLWFRGPIEQAERILDLHTVKLSKYIRLCRLDVLDQVTGQVNKLKTEFYMNKFTLAATYAKEIEDWATVCDNNPDLPVGFGEVVRTQHYPWSYLDEQLQFHFSVEYDVERLLSQSHIEQVAADVEKHLEGIMETAQKNGQYPKISAKNAAKLQEIRTRLETVVMLDPKVQYVIQLINEWLDTHTVPYDKAAATGLIQLLMVLSNPKQLEKIATLAFNSGELEVFTLQNLQDELAGCNITL
ncbi:hypothetical protein HUO09_16970 [Vibrio sp. Y2-5]|uniref:DUF3150 domain-containing protein n=1 Tax=Vibrio sp. Y2-5 TaxID=2743977 RepID=UPI001660DC93|nr:DUF3150 domain-containing protein [Vibrio sp. Y2-5]MBD0788048.1 hypothetical protein [Vibrio sp. Y2-5]